MPKSIKKTGIKKSARIKAPEAPPMSDLNSVPLFSFEYMDNEYSISNCDKTEKASFAETLRIIGKSTWKELLMAPRHGNGYEQIRVSSITGRLPSIVTPDIEHVIAFRFHDRKPVVGLKVLQVFYVIWVDNRMSLYKH